MIRILLVDGQQAVAVAERERPDVVLMDLRMPGLDGIVAANPGAKVVALTTFDDDDAPSAPATTPHRPTSTSPTGNARCSPCSVPDCPMRTSPSARSVLVPQG